MLLAGHGGPPRPGKSDPPQGRSSLLPVTEDFRVSRPVAREQSAAVSSPPDMPNSERPSAVDVVIALALLAYVLGSIAYAARSVRPADPSPVPRRPLAAVLPPPVVVVRASGSAAPEPDVPAVW